MGVQGKVVIVTGASREGQVGDFLAKTFAREGASLVVSARTEANTRRIAEAIKGEGFRAIGVGVDATSETDVARLTERTLAEYGKIDVLVNLAGGLTKYGPTVELSARNWTDELNNNLTTVFLCSKAVIPHMTRAKAGKIINFASVGALTPMPQMAAYNCAKAGVVALTKTLAQELKKFNICVNAIAPGLVQTRSNIEMMKPSPEDLEKKWVSLDAVAQVAIFLASEASDGITGQVIPVYGKGI
ncbi:MAG: SDR family oxidoreductase [candidate division NC10 bacterium]|jgi:NAD(P)-dependent dehydrogenase (short-subunit alcohol dehydrogenase family)|nr:SDR family oxidoreductase [candidate division NC10 bacterium]